MSTTDTPRSPTTPAGELRASLANLWAGWNRFWFAPSDPTPLALMRICCGLLVFYVHLAYSFELQELFGARAWVDMRMSKDLRQQGDGSIVPAEGWRSVLESWKDPKTGKYLEHWPALGTPEHIRVVRAVAPVLEIDGQPMMSDDELKLLPEEREVLVKERLFTAARKRLLSPEERRQEPKYQDDLFRARTLTPEELQKLKVNDQDAIIMNRLLEVAFGDFCVKYPNVNPRTLSLAWETPERRHWVLDYAKRYGVDPRLCYSRGNPIFSFWFHVTDPTWMVVAHVAVLVVIFLFTIGLGTRVMAVLTWMATVSYINREPPMLFGQDTMQNLLLIYLMLAPSGAALSVDRLLSRWWARRQGLPVSSTPPVPRASATFALRMIQVNVCFIYFAAGCSKLLGYSWWEGTAIWLTMVNYQFAPLGSSLYCDFVRYLCQHRFLWEVFMTAGVLHTFSVELLFPWLVWYRSIRWLMLLVAVTLHAGIAILMGLSVFQMLMLVMLLAFFPPQTIHRLTDPIVAGARAYFNSLRRRALADKSLVLSE